METDFDKNAAIEEVERILKEYKQSPEFSKRVNLKRFSSEARFHLEGLNYKIFEIGALSLAQIEAEGYLLAIQNLIRQNPLKILEQSSNLTEVAVFINKTLDINIIGNSNSQPLSVQKIVLKNYERKLLQTIPDIKVEMGDVWDYVHLAYEASKNGWLLFNGWRARTKTLTSSTIPTFANVGGYDVNKKLIVGDALAQLQDPYNYACQLIIPA